MIKTSCKDCMFAQFDIDNIQIGCEFNRLDKFTNKELTKEDGKLFYTINRLCNRCTHVQHKDDFKNPVWDTKKRTRVKVNLFFNLQAFDEKYLRLVCAHLKALYFPPALIHFMNGSNIHRSHISKILDSELRSPYKITTYDTSCHYSNVLFPLLKKDKSDFFTVINDYKIPHMFIHELDYEFNEQLTNIGVFKYRGLDVYSTAIAKFLLENGAVGNYLNIEKAIIESSPNLICQK